MKRVAFVLACAVVLGVSLAACNDVGDCHGQSIKPGGSCSGDQLECPYTLDTPSPACDGTSVEGGLQTSCVCQNGTWSCPSPVSCDAATTPVDAAAESAPSDASTTDARDASAE